MAKWTKEEIDCVKEMNGQGCTAAEIAATLSRSRDAVYGIIGRNIGNLPPVEKQGMVVETGKNTKHVNWTTSTPVLTTEDALAKAAIDTEIWEVERSVINSYESASKDAKGDIVKTPLWQVKLWLKKRKGFSPQEFREKLVQCLQSSVTVDKSRRKATKKNGTMVEISIMDHHFGKLAWEPEVGENYDVKIAENYFLSAAERLLDYAKQEKPSKILIPVGNDFYHVDKGDNTTTSGTRLDADGRWQKAFLAGSRCVREVIEQAKEIAQVEVMIVPGNHDEERAFCLGVVLETLYEKDGRVSVDNSPNLWKATKWGDCLVGFYHGHNSSVARKKGFKGEFLDKFPKQYADTKWRELHIGHTHAEQEDVWEMRTAQTYEMVVVRVIPSLCGIDKWHSDHGYRCPGAAECHIYHSDHGRVGYRVVTKHSLEG